MTGAKRQGEREREGGRETGRETERERDREGERERRERERRREGDRERDRGERGRGEREREGGGRVSTSFALLTCIPLCSDNTRIGCFTMATGGASTVGSSSDKFLSSPDESCFVTDLERERERDF